MTHIALGYRWFPTAAGYHMERALLARGHQVTFVGIGEPSRAGYGETTSIVQIVDALPDPPDLFLWIDSAGRYFPREIEKLPIPTACYVIDVHLGAWRRQAARFFDAVFLAQKDYLASYRNAVGHEQVYWLPLAAAPDVHRHHERPRIYDVAFVGNVAHAHRKTARVRRLELLRSQFQTNDFFRHYTPQEVGELYSQAKIVFNTSIAGDVTMRVFEGTASGALVLTDAIANGLEDLFEIGREIVVYTDDDDLLEKVKYYLAHEDERIAVSQAGQARTLNQHTYPHRADGLLSKIEALSFQQRAPLRNASLPEVATALRQIYTHLHMLDALFDLEQAGHTSPLLRLWHTLPCLARRVLR